MKSTPVDLLLDAIQTAELKALDGHRDGTCRTSEWSCSHCEAAELAAAVGGPSNTGSA